MSEPSQEAKQAAERLERQVEACVSMRWEPQHGDMHEAVRQLLEIGLQEFADTAAPTADVGKLEWRLWSQGDNKVLVYQNNEIETIITPESVSSEQGEWLCERHSEALTQARAPLVAELRSIAEADLSTWHEGFDTLADFKRWAQNRARAALTGTGEATANVNTDLKYWKERATIELNARHVLEQELDEAVLYLNHAPVCRAKGLLNRNTCDCGLVELQARISRVKEGEVTTNKKGDK